MREKSKRGRPAVTPTAAQRRRVSIAAGGGMSHEAIALAMGLSRNTLEKHFVAELSGGAYARRMEALQGLHAAAKRGNAAAVKAYLAADPEFLPPEAERLAEASAAAPALTPAVAPKGKKEQQAAAAVTAQAGTGWEGLLPTGAPH